MFKRNPENSCATKLGEHIPLDLNVYNIAI